MIQQLDIGGILIGVFGGLAFFLFGLDLMTDALKVVAGSRLRTVLARMTRNRFKGVLAGAFVTSIIQSSSVTTVLVVGFITAGLMSLEQSIAVIFGANIGTTVTAQIVAFKITQYALILVAIGFAMHFVSKDQRVRRWGHVVLGLGMVFFGMQLMSDGAAPLRTYQPFIDAMGRMDNPIAGMLAGTIFTGIVQSSSATMGVVIVLASQGFITLEAGIALALGANIGTCVTAFLAGLGKPANAKRSAAVHILFNVLGVALWIGLIGQLAAVVRWMSPSFPELVGTIRLAAETPRQVANAHTLFNLANTFLFIWLVVPMAWLVRRIVPERPLKVPAELKPKYLDDIVLATPALALDSARLELGRLGSLAIRMLEAAPAAILRGSQVDLERLQEMDDDLDTLHGGIVTYLGRLSQRNITKRESDDLHDLLAAANYIENIGDMVETSLVEAGTERVASNLTVSPETEHVIVDLHERVAALVKMAIEAVEEGDPEKAAAVIGAKAELNRIANQAEEHLAARLVAQEPNRLAAFRIETDIMENLKRIYYFAKRIAKIAATVEVMRDERDARTATAALSASEDTGP